ncbi:hypothetical protein DFH07DRAFT_837380 [Mycena maculata]|uniref:RBR-type E3 ubiquitin transferase n=1 Tax=Mycena maculata TaxID=230809 RepID=A0AAD7IG31_9AGAR|nr:hypothetical protein DFH07DRAFT_837380 [Mycena maculata]
MSGPLDLDAASAALIAQLTLDDVEDIRASAKGKAPEGSPPSDAECALRAYSEEVQDTLRFFQDLQLARSMDSALELDQPVLSVLSVVEDCVKDDQQYAEALQNGQTLPAQSEVQRLVEDPQFSLFAQDGGEATAATDSSDSDTEIATDRSAMVQVRAQCVICRDNLRASTAFRAPCEHFYCRDCLSNLAHSCVGDESLFPLQCCRQALPMDGPGGVFAQLEIYLRLSLRAKAREFSTLSKDRLYCPQPTCSMFLGSTVNRAGDVTCPRCRTEVCLGCRQVVHPNEKCGENTALEQVKALALEKNWQTCPGCGQIIDLQQGCYHMTCRCRTEFCYVCAAPWKHCTCPQWEEARLLDTAEQRVEVEMGARARAAAPAIFQERVQQRVERLRYDHDCAGGHHWRRRDGRARCEECHYMLREYLLLCRSCGIAVCVRCSRNRL